MTILKIDKKRLWKSLMEMAKIGATKKGGNCRLALSKEDKLGRDLFVEWCEEAGCKITIDTVGNIFAKRPGNNSLAPSIMTGSHLDTQPTGGRFDGVLGVLAGLEIIRTLNDHNLDIENPIEIVCWTNEEGSRFSPAMMGSGVFSGTFSLSEIRAKKDAYGKILGEELEKIGYSGATTAKRQYPLNYFELHIEQGPILENAKKTIGVVCGAQGQRWYEINILGQESHAGPTPMSLRKDALVGAAKIVQHVNQIGNKFSPLACATVGVLNVSPNSRNVIPGKVFLTCDFRHPTDTVLMKMDEDLKNFCAFLEIEEKLKIEVIDFWYSPPINFNRTCVNAVREAAKSLNYSFADIVSGAGHDAVYLSRVSPTAMIFIPCENGISHNEIENASPEDCEAGTNVLLHAILKSITLA